MNKDELLALAARVEAADADRRRLVFNIGCDVLAALGQSIMEPNPCLSGDAAMTLARRTSGFIASMGDVAADGLPGACLCVSTDPIRHVWGVAAGGGTDENTRLALALTAAALRAMAEEASDD